MKNLLLIFFCFISFPAISQNYLDETCIWKIKDYAWVDLVYFNADYHDYIDGDTLVDGVDYYKLFRKGTLIQGFTPTDSMFINEIDHYLGAIREEDNTWIWVEKDSLSPKLLYDFNLEEGDSIALGNTNYNLILTDSIFHEGVYKKVYNLEGIIFDFIEGFGLITGVVAPLVVPESISYIQCFNKGGENLNPDLTEIENQFNGGFQFEDVESCGQLVSGIDNLDNLKFDIQIFPNPFINEISIETDFEMESIVIFNSIGKAVFNKKENLNNLKLENIVSGFYYILIEGKQNQIAIRKLVKQ